MQDDPTAALQRLFDRAAIQDVLRRYARGVDRGDWALLRSTYHLDAYDDHVEYKGDINGLVAWLEKRFADVDNSQHFLGNCLVEFAGPDVALVETYFASRRLCPQVDGEREAAEPSDAICRQAWGRYVDRFERRNHQWRVAHRTVVVDARFTSLVKGGNRNGDANWGRRDRGDPLYTAQAELLCMAAQWP